MEFGWTPEQIALRDEVRQFISENITPDVAAEMEEGGGRGPTVRALRKKIAERGWLGIAWPKEYGGQGKDQMTQYIVEEEFFRVGVSVGRG